MRIWEFYVYITTNLEKTVLYVGVTNNLPERIIENYLNRGKGRTFAGKNFCYHLLYFEMYKWAYDAFDREKQIKGLRREKKEALISKENPEWKFLNPEIMTWPPPAKIVARDKW